MEKYFKRKLEPPFPERKNDDSTKSCSVEINLIDLPTDPGLRTPILDYNPNVRDQVRRVYM